MFNALTHTGSSIAVYGVRLDVGAKGTVILDAGSTRAFDCRSSDGSLQPKQLLYRQTGLDPTISHQIVVAFDDSSYGPPENRQFLGIDYFEVDNAGVPR